MNTIASLGFRIDATPIGTAVNRLDDLTTAGARTEKQVDLLALAGKALGLAMGTLSAAVVAVKFRQAADDALRFKAALDEVSTLVDTTVVSMKELELAALGQAKAFNSTPIEQTKALYQIISAGASSAAKATEILTAANKLAVGGVTDVRTAADGLTSVLNAYGSKVESAAAVSDAMFTAMRAGKTTIGELSAALGQVAPLAAQMGVSFDELTAATAALSKGGISTSIAVTGLRAILAAVAKPADEARQLAKALGIEFNATALESKGLAGFLKDLEAKTGGNTAALSKLFGGVEALVPIMALMGQAGDDLTVILGQMEQKAGATDEAFKKIADGAAFQVERIFNALNVAAIGAASAMLDRLTPALTAFADLVTGAGPPSVALEFTLKALAITAGVAAARGLYTLAAATAVATANAIAGSAAWAGYMTAIRLLGPVTATAGVALTGLGVAVRFALGPIGLMITAIGLAAAAWTYFAGEGRRAEEANRNMVSTMGGAKTALDAYGRASLDAAAASGALAKKARENAEALRKEAEAAVMAARALRQKAVADAETAEAAARQAAANPLAGGSSKYSAAVAEGQSMEATTRLAAATARRTAATEGAAAAEKKYQDILRGTGVAAVKGDSAAARAAQAAADALDNKAEKAKKAKKEVDDLADASERYLLTISGRVANFNLSDVEQQQREGTIEALIAEAVGRKDLAAAIEVENTKLVDLMKTRDALKELEAAAAQRDAATASGPDSTPYADIADELRLIDQLARDAGQGMADAFGAAGEALGGVLAALTGYRAQLAAIAAAEEAHHLTASQAARERTSAEVNSYGNMARAAKGFFKEGSTGYKALETAEKAFRAVEFALAVKSMVMDAAESGSKVAQSAIRASAYASEAIANAMKSIPFPFNFAAAAAVAAALVAVGVKIFGGGGGSGPSVPTSEDRQAAQGAGSVLGDATAKSESIAHSLEIVAANTNRDLEYSNSMLRALRNIDQNIGALTNVLARQLGVGGALDTSNLGLGTTTKNGGALTGAIQFLFPGLFGTKKTTTLLDQGLSFDPQNLDAIMGGGLAGNAYADISTQTKKKFFGITYSDKTKTSTQTTPLGDDILAEMQRVIASLKEGVLQAAGALGIQGADAALKAFTVNLGTISFKDKTGQEIQDELNAIFGKLGDELSAAVFPAITELQKAGEGAFETLIRVARQYQVVDITLSSIGKTFGAVGLSSLAARERLVELFGSLDDFVEQTAFFADNFLSEAERMAPIQAAVVKEFQRLGVTGVNTKDAFKALVLGLDLSTAAGAEMYAALMAVAPAFAKVFDYLTEGSKDVEAATNALSKAYEREASALQATIDKFKGFADSLRKFRDSLDTGPNALLSPEAQYSATKAAFEQTAAKARLGDATALGDLQGVSQAYLDASKAYYASSGAYFQDLTAVKTAVEAAQATASRTATNAQQQLDALEASVSGLITVNESVLSVRDAITALNAALAAQQAGQAGAGTPFSPATSPTGSTAPSYSYTPTPATGTGGTTTPATYDPSQYNWATYLTHYADVAAWAAAGGGDPSRPIATQTMEDRARFHWFNSGMAEGRTPYARGGIMDRPMTLGESGIGGEAGPEGILPLANVGGRLGVHAVSNDTAEVVAELKALQKQNEALSKRLEQVLAKHGEAVVTSQDNTGKRIERAVAKPSTARLVRGGLA